MFRRRPRGRRYLTRVATIVGRAAGARLATRVYDVVKCGAKQAVIPLSQLMTVRHAL